MFTRRSEEHRTDEREGGVGLEMHKKNYRRRTDNNDKSYTYPYIRVLKKKRMKEKSEKACQKLCQEHS